jgi:hypothetical protein
MYFVAAYVDGVAAERTLHLQGCRSSRKQPRRAEPACALRPAIKAAKPTVRFDSVDRTHFDSTNRWRSGSFGT